MKLSQNALWKSLLVCSLFLFNISLFAQTPLINIGIPAIPSSECTNLATKQDPYCVNRINCCYKSGEGWKITSPSGNLNVQSQQEIEIKWETHPTPYLGGYLITVVGTNGVVFCKDLGRVNSYKMAFCNGVQGGAAVVRVTAYAYQLVDISGQVTYVGKTYACKQERTIFVAPETPVLPGTPQVKTFCSPGDYTLTAPAYTGGGTGYGVRWYLSATDADNAYVYDGYSYTRHFENTDNVFFSYYRINPGACGTIYSPKTTYTMVKYPAVSVITPAPQTEVVCSPGTYNISANTPPVNGYMVRWYDNLTATTPIFEGITNQINFKSPGTYTYYISYQAPNLCNDGYDEGPKGVLTVQVLNNQVIAAPAGPKTAYYNNGPKTYTLTYKPSVPGMDVYWYDNATATIPIYTGENYNRYLSNGTTTLFVSQGRSSCNIAPSNKTTFTAIVTNNILNVLDKIAGISLSPNPAGQEVFAILEKTIEASQGDVLKLKVIDHLGLTKIEIPYNIEGTQIDLSSIGKGIYSVQVFSELQGLLGSGNLIKE